MGFLSMVLPISARKRLKTKGSEALTSLPLLTIFGWGPHGGSLNGQRSEQSQKGTVSSLEDDA